MRWLKVGIIFVVVLALAAGGAILISIQIGISDAIGKAQAIYPHPGDDVAALVALMDSDKQKLEARNRAVWALGRLGDPKALPALEKHFDGKPCNHDERLCQYELAKAINSCLDEMPGEHQRPSMDASKYEQAPKNDGK
jgi:hypothetical protein